MKKTTVRAIAGNANEAEDLEALSDGVQGSRPKSDVVFSRNYERIPVAVIDEDEDADASEPRAPKTSTAPAEVLNSDEVAKAFRYGSSYIVPVVGDSNEWKLQSGERSFKVLGAFICVIVLVLFANGTRTALSM